MQTVFKEFKDTRFYWVDPIHRKGKIDDTESEINSVRYLTKAEFCGKLGLIN